MKVRNFVLILVLVIAVQSDLIGKYNKFKAYTKEFNKRYESKLHELYRFSLYLQNLE